MENTENVYHVTTQSLHFATLPTIETKIKNDSYRPEYDFL